MNEIIERMLAHKSIRKYKDVPVTDVQVQWIVKSAQSAATSSFLQAYSIIQVIDPDKRAQLRLLCGDQDYVATAPVFLVFCADLSRLKSVCANLSENSSYESGWTESFIIATVDTALAGQNAMLAAESMGMGGVYIGGIRNNPDQVSDLLTLPDEVYPVFGMCLGYPDQSPEVKERLPISMVLHKDEYQPLDMGTLAPYDQRIKTYYSRRTQGKIKDTWSQSVDKKFKGELRKHMKPFLEARGFITK